MNFENHQIMGVINITPNSFSDGGQYNQCDKFLEKFKSLIQNNVAIVDIGAESTAPINTPITLEEEIARFDEVFFPSLLQMNKNDFQSIAFSIDTYRYETFKYVYDKFQSFKLQNLLIWNDVSGVIDSNLMDFLATEVPKAHYIFSHNRIENRFQTNSHMQFIDEEVDLIEEMNQKISTFHDISQGKISKQRLYFDPCFGFAKTKEQNYFLINNIDKLEIDSDIPLVLGISRKSFLKALLIEHPLLENSSQIESLNAVLTAKFLKMFSQRKIFHRLHTPESYILAKQYYFLNS